MLALRSSQCQEFLGGSPVGRAKQLFAYGRNAARWLRARPAWGRAPLGLFSVPAAGKCRRRRF